MKDFFTPFKVGLLVIVSAVAGLFMLTRLTSDGSSAGDEYVEVYVLFDDATGPGRALADPLGGHRRGRDLGDQLRGR